MNMPVMIYGAGFRGGREFIRISEENIHVENFIDKNAHEKVQYYGAPVYSVDEIIKNGNMELPIIIAIDNTEIRKQISTELKTLGLNVYDSFDQYYIGDQDADVTTIVCGGKDDGYGEYKIAPQLFSKENRVAFTFGIGADCSFEEELLNEHGFTVFSFDPGIKSKDYINKTGLNEKYPGRFHFENFAISDMDGIKEFRKAQDGWTVSESVTPWTSDETEPLTVHRLETLMNMFGQEKIDVLKLDVEGSEFVAMPEILQSGIKIGQICIEVHARMYVDSVSKSRAFKHMMNEYGYRLAAGSGIRDQLYI